MLQSQVTTPFNGFNVRDDLKNLSEEDIKAFVQAEAFPAKACMVNIDGDFNFSSVIRNANAFGFSTVYHVAPTKQWDRRGAVGTHHYTDVIHREHFGQVWTELALQGYTSVALENNIEYTIQSLYHFQWPEKTLLVVGSESQGLSKDILDLCDHVVSIPQYGSVRSINVANASGIAMNAYAQQWSEIK